jgi:hypothetical protein
MTPALSEPVKIPLVKPGARETFVQSFRNVPVPIAIAIRPPDWKGQEGMRLLAYRDMRVLHPAEQRALKDYEDDFALAKKLNSLVLVTEAWRRGGENFSAFLANQKRERDKVSPYTPFVMLHRLGDILRDVSTRGSSSFDGVFQDLNDAENELHYRVADQFRSAKARERRHVAGGASKQLDDESNFVQDVVAEIFSRGVDTAAGRMGTIGSDYMSDLFAKYLLTGEIAYSPTNPPPTYDGEVEFRQKVADIAPVLFQTYVQMIKQKTPGVLYV